VHTHITNTRIGDVELLERRYPVLVHTFGLRQGSAGAGKFGGGEGAIRELEFLEPLQVSILSEVLDLVHNPRTKINLTCSHSGGRVDHTVLKVAPQGHLGAILGSNNHARRMETLLRAVHRQCGRSTLVERLRSAWVKEIGYELRHLVGVDGASLRDKGNQRQNMSRCGQHVEALQSGRLRKLVFEIEIVILVTCNHHVMLTFGAFRV